LLREYQDNRDRHFLLQKPAQGESDARNYRGSEVPSTVGATASGIIGVKRGTVPGNSRQQITILKGAPRMKKDDFWKRYRKAIKKWAKARGIPKDDLVLKQMLRQAQKGA
jgi:hypothetical protein